VPIVYATDKSDIKIPWELARFQFLGTLGRAWAYTGNNTYCRQACALIDSFLAENPLGIGLHWTSPMEAAIRAANWIVADSFFNGAAAWGGSFRDRVRLSLYDHGRFIHSHLEWDGRGINNNHYIADLAGLFIIGLYLHQIGEGERWLNFALKELNAEIDSQVAPDGMHYENSLGYHRLVFEMLFYTHRLGIVNGIDAVRRWEPRLISMAEFTLGMTMPDRRVPNFGDNDDGLWLSGTPRPPDDHRYLVGLSAAAFGRPDPRSITFSADEIPEDIYWFVGAAAAREFHRARNFPQSSPSRLPAAGTIDNISAHHPLIISSGRPSTSSQVFRSSGMIVLRSDNGAVLISANPVGTGGIGGHKHNDLLSFIFTVGTNEVVIDPGTYTYTGEPNMRNQLRGTGAHNTVMVDGAEQNRFYPRQLFWVRDDAHPRITHCRFNHSVDRVIVEHDGYRRLRGRVLHRRLFSFIKSDNILVIRDELEGTGIHDIRAVINLGPGVINADDPCRVILQLGENDKHAGFLIERRPGTRSGIEPCWRSEQYGKIIPGMRLVRQSRVQLPTHWMTVIGVFDHAVDWRLMEQLRDSVPHPSQKQIADTDVQPERVSAEACA